MLKLFISNELINSRQGGLQLRAFNSGFIFIPLPEQQLPHQDMNFITCEKLKKKKKNSGCQECKESSASMMAFILLS